MRLPPPKFGYSSDSIEEYLDVNNLSKLKSDIEEEKKEALVGFIGGPPCPDFSVGGKNRGKDGENGRLSQVYVDLICKTQPDYFLFENVKGLWRTKKHREFYESLKAKLTVHGYALTDRLTNCIEYGAPQDRDRILLVGIRKKSFSEGVWGVISEKFPWTAFSQYSREQVFQNIEWPVTSPYLANSRRKMPKELIEFEALTVQYWFEKNQVTSHPNGSHYFTPRQALPKFQTILEGDTSKKSFKRLHRWRYSPTAAYGNNEVHLHPYKDRRLSAAEALSIQTLPSEFELPPTMTLTNMFKTIGNGVPFVLSLGIAKALKQFLGEGDEKRRDSKSNS